jgi:hypothetical protein
MRVLKSLLIVVNRRNQMGYFKQLDVMIQDVVHYKPEYTTDLGMIVPAQNQTDYWQLRDEIEEHIAGNLAIDQLSPIAKDVMNEWEGLMQSMNERPEQEERF